MRAFIYCTEAKNNNISAMNVILLYVGTSVYRPYLRNSHSPLSKQFTNRGQRITYLMDTLDESSATTKNGIARKVCSHTLLMQWKWNAWEQTPQATVHSWAEAVPWFAWHSIHMSIMWFRHIAQLSTSISHAQSATAFHFLISNLFCGSELSISPWMENFWTSITLKWQTW